MEIFHQCLQYTPSNLSDFPSTIYVTLFADKCLKLRLLIDICTVFCRIEKKMHSLLGLTKPL